jgi:hypothetical protein
MSALCRSPLFGAGVDHSDQRARARPSQRPRRGRGDVDLHDDGERLLDNVDHYKAIIHNLTGMELCLPKCTLLVSSGVVVDAVRAKAAVLGIAVATEGTVVMGAPVAKTTTSREPWRLTSAGASPSRRSTTSRYTDN